MRRAQQIPSLKADTISGAGINEALGLLMGKKLGSGAYRDVYECPMDPTVVVKYEHSCSGRFCNIDEWNIWRDAQENPEIAAWLAPVRFVSSCGQFLIQDRTAPITRVPKRVPSFMCDLKAENMGRLGRRVVFHDYANTLIETQAFKRLKLVDAS